MPHNNASTPMACDDLTGDLQHALAALADVEFAFESACERLSAQSGPEVGKNRVRQQLEVERSRRREPLLRRLDELDQRMKALVFGRPSSEWQAPTDRETPAHSYQVLA